MTKHKNLKKAAFLSPRLENTCAMPVVFGNVLLYEGSDFVSVLSAKAFFGGAGE